MLNRFDRAVTAQRVWVLREERLAHRGAADAEALRRQLQQNNVNPRDLDDIIRDLYRFDNDRLYADPNGLAQLQAQVTDKMKKFEFSLRRKTDAANESLSLSGSDQVPEGFRTAIEEYYRSLAKKQSPR